MATLDIHSSEFWDLGKLDGELRRVADICAGCRRCLPLCPSFKVLFDRLDTEAVDGEADKLPKGDLQEVVDLCYQCKLCFNHCPYTPPHRWEVDFPRLMLRARATQARAQGVSRQDRLLGNTELVGRLGTLTAPLSNWAAEWRLHRAFLESVVGIHRDRRLPRFHRQTFSRWFRKHKSQQATGVAAAKDGKVGRNASAAGVATARVPAASQIALFATCPVEYNDPAVGRATVRVLERSGVDVSLPPQRCCGMPYLDGGAMDEARALIRDNVRTLAAAVREGREIVVPGPTCSYMLKQEYPWLDGSEDARLVATHTRDLFEFLARLAAEGRLDTNFTRPIGPIAYHVPCHLRAQNIGTKSADVLRRIPGAEVTVIERCSAVDGTWGLKRQYHELSLRLAQPLFDAIGASKAPTCATDCPLAALQINQGTGATPRHPIQILAAAYGVDEP
jgi:glycerol-3-phosphate dehydrogenase subunit C